MLFHRALRRAPALIRQLSSPSPNKVLSVESCNPRLVNAEYAVRGELVLRALEIEGQLQQGADMPFQQLVYCNIGNPQQLRQRPITFFRQVLALTTYPELMEQHAALFPSDVVERARRYLEAVPSGTGAYSNSMGVDVVRREVADFIERRDGYPASPDHIFLTDGASPAVQMLLNCMIRDQRDGVMVPIPQYPLYSASIELFGGTMCGYYLDEGAGWGMSLSELERAWSAATADGKTEVRGLAVINPGNPTGQCLSKANIREVIQFCVDKSIVLMADEVYQENIWQSELPFHSFKSVAAEMGVVGGAETCLELASFHSVSKGFIGECGRRGGYVELCGFDEEVVSQLYKRASINLCSNLDGQLMMGLMVSPPVRGEPSFDLYEAERDGILSSMRRRADMLHKALNEMEGVTCNAPQGALYAFPTVSLPPAAVAAASAAGKKADTFYCLALLEATGVVVVPGSGFGQKEGEFHFRTTILPAEDQIAGVITRMKEFHEGFLLQHSS